MNEGCEEEIAFKHLSKHKQECEWRKLVCPNEGCGKIFSKIYLLEHQTSDCETQIISCLICSEKVLRADLPDHNKQSVVLHVSKMNQKMKEIEEENKLLRNTVSELNEKLKPTPSKKRGKQNKLEGAKETNNESESESEDQKLYEEVLGWEEKVLASTSDYLECYGEEMYENPMKIVESDQDEVFESLVRESEQINQNKVKTLRTNAPALYPLYLPYHSKRKFYEISTTTESTAKEPSNPEEEDDEGLLEEVLDWEDNILKFYSRDK